MAKKIKVEIELTQKQFDAVIQSLEFVLDRLIWHMDYTLSQEGIKSNILERAIKKIKNRKQYG